MSAPPAPVLPGTCPACGAAGLRPGERVPVRAVAEGWARQGGRSVDEVERAVRADLGAAEASFRSCGACGLEVAEPVRSWSADHYPREEYGVAWDHLRALEELRGMPPARLLEIGCADGKFLERAAALGHRVTGIDFVPAAVEAARARGVDARVGDVASLGDGAGEGGFGVVVLFQVIEHLEDPDGVFRQISTVAAPDALLLVGCPAERRYTRRFAHAERLGESDFWDWPPQHVLRWTPAALTAFLRRHGWEVETVEHEPFTVAGAAAHLAAVDGAAGGWYGQPLRRRLETLRWRMRLWLGSLRDRPTGIRLFVAARRGGSPR